jgi:cytoskeleton protein RodZ
MHFSLPARRIAARFTTVQAAPAHPAPKPAPATPRDTAQHPAAAPNPHPVQVAITAKEDAWVQATADGKTLFATLLRAGETRPVDADGWVKIRTGNAGGIDLSLNGRPLDSLGPAGQVRSVTLTAAGPQIAPVAQDPQTPATGNSPL